MTNDQKAKIIAMRGSGHSYARIAEDLSISINTIKTFCRRRRSITDSGITVCKQCGVKIEIQSGITTRDKVRGPEIIAADTERKN